MSYLPNVPGTDGRIIDLFSQQLSENGILNLAGPSDTVTAALLCNQMLWWDVQVGNFDTPLRLYINSPGGSVSDGLAILDTMRQMMHPVHTYCLGLAASMAAVIFAAGDKRYVLPHSQLMIHQPSSGIDGQASDFKIAAAQIVSTREILNKLLADYTCQPLERVVQDTDRDYYLNADDAVSYGLADFQLFEPDCCSEYCASRRAKHGGCA